MKPVSKMLVAAGSLAISSTAMAGTGVYAFLDAGQSTIDATVPNTLPLWSPTYHPDEQSEPGFNTGVGFAFNDYVAIEAHYTDFGELEQTGGSDGSVTSPVDVYSTGAQPYVEITDVRAYGLGVMLGTPVGDNFKMYLKAGAEQWEMDTKITWAATQKNDFDDVGVYYGFGFQVDFTDHLSLRNDYLWHNLEDGDADADIQTIMLGLVYNF